MRRGVTLYNVRHNMQLGMYELLEDGRLYQMDMFMLDRLKTSIRGGNQGKKNFVAEWYRSLPSDERKKVKILQPNE